MITYLSNLFSGLDPQPEAQPRQKIVATSGNFLTGNSKRSGGKTRKGLSTYQKTTTIDHYATRQNARAAAHESIEARVLLKRSNDYIIGKGLRLEPNPAFNVLGLTREQAESWSDDVKEKFDLWAKSKKSDLTGRNNFYQNMRFYGWQYARDGEVFARFNYSPDKNLLNPLQISFLDPNQIRGDEITSSLGPSTQDTGILTDANGKETGYKVWINNPQKQGFFKFIDIPATDSTGRPLMIHGYDAENAGQTRGISKLSHALQDFEDITSYSGATLTRAINGASLNLTVENEHQDPSDMGLATLDDGQAGIPTETAVTESTETPTTLGADGVTFADLHEATLTEPGVNVFGGRQGDKLKATPDMAPPETYSSFLEGKFAYLAASFSMPAEVSLMKFGTSFSASRGAMGLYAQVAEIERNDIASDFLDPVYFAWISEEIAKGRIKAPGFSDPVIREAWLQNRWIGAPPPDIDPGKTVAGIKGRVELGMSDLDSEAMLLNGSSGKANRARLAKQLPELPTDPYDLKTEPEVENNG